MCDYWVIINNQDILVTRDKSNQKRVDFELDKKRQKPLHCKVKRTDLRLIRTA